MPPGPNFVRGGVTGGRAKIQPRDGIYGQDISWLHPTRDQSQSPLDPGSGAGVERAEYSTENGGNRGLVQSHRKLERRLPRHSWRSASCRELVPGGFGFGISFEAGQKPSPAM